MFNSVINFVANSLSSAAPAAAPAAIPTTAPTAAAGPTSIHSASAASAAAVAAPHTDIQAREVREMNAAFQKTGPLISKLWTAWESIFKEESECASSSKDEETVYDQIKQHLFGSDNGEAPCYAHIDFAKAIALLEVEAEREDSKAQYLLGLLYNHGMASGNQANDDDIDLTKVLDYFTQAAKQDFARAHIDFAIVYLGVKDSELETGEGIKVSDVHKIAFHLRKYVNLSDDDHQLKSKLIDPILDRFLGIGAMGPWPSNQIMTHHRHFLVGTYATVEEAVDTVLEGAQVNSTDVNELLQVLCHFEPDELTPENKRFELLVRLFETQDINTVRDTVGNMTIEQLSRFFEYLRRHPTSSEDTPSTIGKATLLTMLIKEIGNENHHVEAGCLSPCMNSIHKEPSSLELLAIQQNLKFDFALELFEKNKKFKDGDAIKKCNDKDALIQHKQALLVATSTVSACLAALQERQMMLGQEDAALEYNTETCERFLYCQIEEEALLNIRLQQLLLQEDA